AMADLNEARVPVNGHFRPSSRRSASGGSAKLAFQVARQIEEDIISAKWPIGMVIGTESELMDRFKVSREVMREAVRIVEHCQIAAMKRGASGGLVVREPQAETAVMAMVIY